MTDKNLKIIISGRYDSGQKSLCKRLKIAGFVVRNYHDPYDNIESNFDDTDIIVIKPDCIDDFTKKHPDTAFRLIYMIAPTDQRLDRADTEEIRKIIEDEENDPFYENFETTFRENRYDSENIICIAEINHDFNNNDALDSWVEFIKIESDIHDKVMPIISKLCDSDILERDPETQKIRIVTNNDDGTFSEEYVTQSIFVETVLSSHEGMALMMKQWISLTDKSVFEN